MMTGKLSEERLKQLRDGIKHAVEIGALSFTQEGNMYLLFGHIEAMEAEQRAGASRSASDAFEVGHANATFIERQTKQIEKLEQRAADYDRIDAELLRQDEKWGDQSHHTMWEWFAILGEEVGEVAKAILEYEPEAVFKELVQVAAVAVRMMRAAQIEVDNQEDI